MKQNGTKRQKHAKAKEEYCYYEIATVNLTEENNLKQMLSIIRLRVG